MTPGTTALQAVVKEDGSGLHCLIVQVNDLVGAVTHVREGTLFAALKGKGEFWGETDEVAGRIKGVEVSGGADVALGDGDVSSKGDGVSRGSSFSDGEGSGGEDRGDGQGEGKEVEEEAKPSKMQILVWRSEGMGQYMADELGPKFRIPKGFH